MKRYSKAIYWGLPISLILAISIILHLGWINAFDNFFEGLVHIVPNLKGLMLKITFLADTKVDLIWMVLIAVILWFRKQRPLATNLVLTMITGDAVGWIIKHLIQRARPVQHLAVDDGFSFPSFKASKTTCPGLIFFSKASLASSFIFSSIFFASSIVYSSYVIY